jgi:hypothetical protein
MDQSWVAICETYPVVGETMRIIDGVFACAAAFRLGMMIKEPCVVSERFMAAARRVASDALKAQQIECDEFERVIDAVVQLGSTYRHRFDRMEYQMVIIGRMLDTLHFPTLERPYARG